jgi:hypothetical protein
MLPDLRSWLRIGDNLSLLDLLVQLPIGRLPARNSFQLQVDHSRFDSQALDPTLDKRIVRNAEQLATPLVSES